MDKAMAEDLDRHLTTEPTNDEVEYEVGEVPIIRALDTMYVDSDGGPFRFVRGMHLDQNDRDDELIRQHLYDYYEANPMAKSLFEVGWAAGVERQLMRIVEPDELNEGDEIDDGEARFYYLHGYIAGQLASYEVWASPYTKTLDDDWFEEH